MRAGHRRRWLAIAGWTVGLSARLAAQEALAIPTGRSLAHVGWAGFLDLGFLLSSLGSLALAALLGAVVAYHPATLRTIDTPHEAEVPRVHVVYAVVGAVIGVVVLTYGMGVGVVVFGIGGLIRFRTDTGSARDTGRLILVTLIGLTAGLGLPHFAVLTTAFAFGLVFVLEGRFVGTLQVRGVPATLVPESATAWRAALVQEGCSIINARARVAKEHLTFVFRAPRHAMPDMLHDRTAARVPPELRGTPEWETE